MVSNKKNKKQHSNNNNSIHFSSSAYQNSPDPSCLPIPNFDDDEINMINNLSLSEKSTPTSSPESTPLFQSLNCTNNNNKSTVLKSILNL